MSAGNPNLGYDSTFASPEAIDPGELERVTAAVVRVLLDPGVRETLGALEAATVGADNADEGARSRSGTRAPAEHAAADQDNVEERHGRFPDATNRSADGDTHRRGRERAAASADLKLEADRDARATPERQRRGRMSPKTVARAVGVVVCAAGMIVGSLEGVAAWDHHEEVEAVRTAAGSTPTWAQRLGVLQTMAPAFERAALDPRIGSPVVVVNADDGKQTEQVNVIFDHDQGMILGDQVLLLGGGDPSNSEGIVPMSAQRFDALEVEVNETDAAQGLGLPELKPTDQRDEDVDAIVADRSINDAFASWIKSGGNPTDYTKFVYYYFTKVLGYPESMGEAAELLKMDWKEQNSAEFAALLKDPSYVSQEGGVQIGLEQAGRLQVSPS